MPENGGKLRKMTNTTRINRKKKQLPKPYDDDANNEHRKGRTTGPKTRLGIQSRQIFTTYFFSFLSIENLLD